MTLGFTVGDDIFISYTRRDASIYAAGLAAELAEKGFSCFIDKLGTDPDRDLPKSLLRKIRSCTMLVVVGTEWAGTRKTVETEIKEYLKRQPIAIVPINFDATIYQARWYPLIEGVALETETNPEALKDGNPSTAVINRIEKQFTYTRRNERLRRITIRTAIILGLLVLASIATTVYARRQVGRADRAAIELSKFEVRRAEIAKKLYSTQGLVQVGNHPGSLAFDGVRVWVANIEDNTVQAIEPGSGLAEPAIQVGQSPGAISFYGGLVWVANYQSNSVQAIDPARAGVVKTINVGRGPIALSYDGKRLWVLNGVDRTVQSFDPAGGAASVATNIGSANSSPAALTFDGKSIWVANIDDNHLQEIDPATGKVVRRVEVNLSPHFLTFDGEYLWTADRFEGDINVINPQDESIVNRCKVDSEVSAIAPGRRSLWITTGDKVSEFDVKRCEVGSHQAGNAPTALLITDTRVWVTNPGDNTLKVINPLAARLSTPIKVGLDPGLLFYINEQLWLVSPGSKFISIVDPSIPNLQTSVSLEIYPRVSLFDGTRLWIVDRSGIVQAIDPKTRKRIVSHKIDDQPGDLAFDGKRLWVTKLNDQSVQSINAETGEMGKPIRIGAEPVSADPPAQPINSETVESGRPLIIGESFTLAFDGVRLWVAGVDQYVRGIDPDSGAVTVNIEAGEDIKLMCFDGNKLWIASGSERGTLEAFDPSTGKLLKTFAVNQKISALAFDGRRLWVAEFDRKTIRPVDVNSFEVGSRINVGIPPTALAFDGQRLWIGSENSKAVQFIDGLRLK